MIYAGPCNHYGCIGILGGWGMVIPNLKLKEGTFDVECIKIYVIKI